VFAVQIIAVTSFLELSSGFVICNLSVKYPEGYNTWTNQISMYGENKITLMFQSINSTITKFAKYNETFNHTT